jgi:glutamyl-tRNA synthetase
MTLLFPVEIEREQEIVLDCHQRGLIDHIIATLEQVEGTFDPQSIEETLRKILDEEGAKLKDVAAAIRMAVTGQKAGPGLFDTLAVVGRDLTLSRLREFMKG